MYYIMKTTGLVKFVQQKDALTESKTLFWVTDNGTIFGKNNNPTAETIE